MTFAPRLPVRATHQEMLQLLDEIRTEFWSDPARHRPFRMDLFGSRRTILMQLLKRIGMADGNEVAELAHEMAHHFTEAQLGTLTAFPGAIEAVQELRARGVKLALITNGEGYEQRRKIAQPGRVVAVSLSPPMGGTWRCLARIDRSRRVFLQLVVPVWLRCLVIQHRGVAAVDNTNPDQYSSAE